MIARLTNDCLNKIINFIEECDNLFPIPISKKTNIPEYVEKVLTHGDVFACMIDGEIAGLIFGYANDTENYTAYLSLLCVKPAFQGKGISKRLIDRFKDHCTDAKMKRITLYTHVTNTTAIKLYEKYGFVMSDSDRDNNCFFVYDIEGREKEC